MKRDINIKYLNENEITVRDELAKLGLSSHQWYSRLSSEGQYIDQISQVINILKNNMDSRYIIASIWNVKKIDKITLLSCYALFQFFITDNRLFCQMYQRNINLFLGITFNIALYILLTIIIVTHTYHLKPRDFIHTWEDVHMSLNHSKQVDLQLSRISRSYVVMKLNPKIKNIFDFKYKDFQLMEYNSYLEIKASIAA